MQSHRYSESIHDTSSLAREFKLTLQAVANGDSSAALSVASIYAQTFSQQTTGPDVCNPQTESAIVRERILSSMLKLDSVTFSSSTYILQVGHLFSRHAIISFSLFIARQPGLFSDILHVIANAIRLCPKACSRRSAN